MPTPQRNLGIKKCKNWYTIDALGTIFTIFKGSLDTLDSAGNLDNVNNVNRVDKRLRNQDLEIRIQESSHKKQDQDSSLSSQGARSPTQP